MSGMREREVRAVDVRPGDYIAGLGRVGSYTDSGGPRSHRRIVLHSEGGDWRINMNPRAAVVLIDATRLEES